MAFDPARVKSLFLEASDLTSPEERATFLDRACAGEPDLRARVEVLLAVEHRAGPVPEPEATGGVGGYPEAAPSGLPETNTPGTHKATDTYATAAGPPSKLVAGEYDTYATVAALPTTPRDTLPGGSVGGQVIAGRYTLLEPLGEGGMGTVYRAEQTQPVRRQVALKLIKIGMDSRAVLARFDAERQALALMDHTNIARVYDGGTTEANQPFFVMELVEGVPITSYCDQHRMPVRARLELFATVCQAVQHAHQKGIIHRDLKPSNVMVTEVDGRPTPKVIDFGVAKATEFALTDQSLGDTGAIVGTPAYMSPEQADPSSMDIDTRTDVYALGVILYEMLAGSLPIDPSQLKRGGLHEMLRMVREVDPPKPSTKVSTADALPSIAATRNIDPAHLRRTLSGDLDWIVMKALEKDRARRYDTPNGFAADILRHLSSEPVQAAPPSQAYRLRKFVRKHRGGVIAASLVLLALVGGIVGTSIGFYQADRARKDETRRAEAEAKERRRAEAAEAETGRKAEEVAYRLDNSNFLLASAAYDNRDVRGARFRLDEVAAKNRGWEWQYLRRQSIGGIFTLYGHTVGVTSLAFSPDDTRIVTGGKDKSAKVWDARTGAPLLELKGHTEPVTSVAFSPDGSRIVTGAGGILTQGEAKVWDTRTGMPLLDLKGHAGDVTSVAFSPDGTRIVTGGGNLINGEAKVWDARTGMPLLELKELPGRVYSVAFSPDGSRFVTGSQVWDARSGTPLLELKGHTLDVTSVAFSPDGSHIVTGSGDKTAKVWDARNGTPLLELKGHTEPVESVAFSPDGSRIVTGSWDKTAKVWDARNGTPLLELKGHTEPVTSVAFSPDGSRIVTGSGDKTAKVWDARSGTPLLELKGHTKPVTSVAFSPDGSRIVSGSEDKTAKVWDARNGTPMLELKGHTELVTSVAFSPDGSRIVTGSGDKTAKVWEARTGTPMLELKGHKGEVRSVAFSPDGSRIATGSGDKTAKVWDARTGTPLLELKGHKGDANCVAFSPNGTRIVSGSGDKTAKVWDARTGTPLLELKGHTVNVTSVAFSPDGTRIVTGAGGVLGSRMVPGPGMGRPKGEARVWDARSGSPLLELKGHEGEVRSVAFSPDGSRIVTGARDPKVWDARTGTPLLELKGHTELVRSVAFSPDGSRIVTGGGGYRKGEAKVWEARTGTPLLELKGHTGEVMSVAFSPDSSRIVTFTGDLMSIGAARVWDTRTGTPLLMLKGYSVGVNSVAFSPDGSRIVTGSDDQTARVWDARTGTLLLELKGHKGMVMSVAFSPDGSRIVTGSDDQTARVWDARTGTLLLELKGPSVGVYCVAFSPDGSRIVTVDGYRRNVMTGAKVWDARTGTLLLELEGQTSNLTSVAFSPDGSRIVSGGEDKTANVWDARTGTELKGEPIPPTPQPGRISPDGRWFAHLAYDHVELIPLQPDEQELAYRHLQTQPNLWRYREGYEEARKANDDFATRFYLKLLPPAEQKVVEAEAAAKREISAGRTQDALAHLVTVSTARPEDTRLAMDIATLQAWFGRDNEYADTCGRALEFARDTFVPENWNDIARICSLRPTQDKVRLEAALALARKAVEIAKNNGNYDFIVRDYQLTLGMAEYRIGHFAEADAALIASTNRMGSFEHLPDIYHAMSLFRQGKEDEARKLAIAASEKMEPLPKDEQNLLANRPPPGGLILWLAYKEAKALIGFDAPPAAPAKPDGK